jgi:streptomycin 6-kinase
LDIPDHYRSRIDEVRGPAGLIWLDQLPAIAAECAARWSLTLGEPFILTYNYVLAVTRHDGTPAVLKLGYPADSEFHSEMAALQLFDGHGMSRLLEHDAGLGGMLLERLEPGDSLQGLPEIERAISIACGIMRQLWRPAPENHVFPTVARWGQGFDRVRGMFGGTSGPLPADLYDEAQRRYEELTATQSEHVLLHGDLHYGNILSALREPWLAIDPKGLIGEREYDVGDLLRNRVEEMLESPDPRAAAARRIDQISEELGFDRERVRAWCFCQAVLSALWSVEDHGYGWESAIAVAELLA